jgi:hypothetical protein
VLLAWDHAGGLAVTAASLPCRVYFLCGADDGPDIAMIGYTTSKCSNLIVLRITAPSENASQTSMKHLI